MIGPAESDPLSRTWPDDVRLSAPEHPRVAIPRDEDLTPLSSQARAAFRTAVKRLEAAGAEATVIDVSPLLQAARLLYDGALVAERYAGVGEFIARDPSAADPTVAGIILAAAELPAHALAADQERLDVYKALAHRLLSGYDALLLPTTTEHPDIAAVQADPVTINSRLGTYTNFVNLLDLAAVAVPAGGADGSPFGVSVITRAFEDQPALDIAARLTGEQAPAPCPTPESTSPSSVPTCAASPQPPAHRHRRPLRGRGHHDRCLPPHRADHRPGEARPRAGRPGRGRPDHRRTLDPLTRRPRPLPGRPARSHVPGADRTRRGQLGAGLPMRPVHGVHGNGHHPPRRLARVPREQRILIICAGMVSQR